MTLVPDSFLALAANGPSWAAWLDDLPGLLRDLVEEWSLTVEGPSAHGNCAVVIPVRTAGGEAAVLKVGWPHWEAEHEALALQTWGGRGAVRLLRADPKRFALLLERLHTEDLSELWDVQACELGREGRPGLRNSRASIRRSQENLRHAHRAQRQHRSVQAR